MQTSRMRCWAACALAIFATGCAQLKAPPYAADYEALDRLQASKPGSVAVATTQPTDPTQAVNRLSLRGSPLVSPSGTFAKYFEDALIRDLKEASAFDTTSRTRLDARILNNEISIGGFVTGTGFMEGSREGRSYRIIASQATRSNAGGGAVSLLVCCSE